MERADVVLGLLPCPTSKCNLSSFLASILQIGRRHGTCNILPPITLSLSLPARRGPRFDMCLLAPLKSHLSTKGHKDGCYNGKCMFCGTPAHRWRHICVRGRLNSGGVGNNRRTLFTEVSIFEPFTRDNTHNGL